MRSIKKLICLALVLAMFAAMALGSGSPDNSETKGLENGENNDTKNETTISEQVLLEYKGLVITAKSYETDSIWGEGVKLLIENSSEKSYGIGCDAVIVNNYMITSLFSSTVAAGKKANETLRLLSNELEAANIENIGQIEIYFRIFNPDTYETIYTADVVTIKTSEFEKMDTVTDESGVELVNKNGIRIIGKYVDEDSFWGAGVLLFIENKTGTNITVACDDMSVNGFMITPLFACTVYNEKMAVDEISILSTELEENEITSIENIELVFRIYNSDTFETIMETQPISFSAK